MKKSDLSEFAVEEEGFKLQIKRGSGQPQIITTAAPAATILQPAVAAQAPATESTPEPVAEEKGINYITSPMVGTFYRSPSPETPSFVEVNQAVQETSVICIIEAMKIMNEIQAEKTGTILEALVENGQAVEFGQRLFKIKTS
ncbi:MAG: acetyl-CoA carboxylase biotin carboxyl carrier protein [Opitutaceae bacterium]|nr:acetyl-CoA carboxylase biotin carboxyl carrier protein [Opitutaceae bacterium]